MLRREGERGGEDTNGYNAGGKAVLEPRKDVIACALLITLSLPY